MHACEMLPIAAVIADCNASFVAAPPPNSSTGLHEYWSVSRLRLDAWTRSFGALMQSETATADEKPGDMFAMPPVVEEVLFSEVLTRVWAAAATAHDFHHKSNIIGPVARSIFLGHQETRNRALLAILRLQQEDEAEARRLNLLRQKCERWTDMLLAYFPLHGEIKRLTYDAQRSRDFAMDLAHERCERDAAQALTMASLETAVRRGAVSTPANGELNQRIAAAVIGCLPADAFNASGLFAALWQTRIESTTDRTFAMVQELLSLECPSDAYGR